MPGGFPLGLEIYNANNVGGLTGGITITAGAANVKGAFATLVSSVVTDVCFVSLEVVWITSVGLQLAIDIAVGAAGSEVVIANNLLFNQQNAGNLYMSRVFPLQILAGTRISARCQTNNGASTIGVSLTTFDGAFTQLEGPAGVDAVGFNPTNTSGTAVATPGSGSAKGSFVQLAAATTRDYLGFFVNVDSQAAALQTFDLMYLDIAIGASGSESAILPNLLVTEQNAQNVIGVNPTIFPIPIPSGTRVAACLGALIATTQPVTIGVTVFGIYQ